MSSEDIAKAKIIILHLVSDAPGVTYHMLMDKCMESLTMDFFTFSQCYNELLAGNLLEKVSENDGTDSNTADSAEDILYITKGGKAVLDDISAALNNSTKNYLANAKIELNDLIAERNSIRSSVLTEEDHFYACLSINDKTGTRFETKVRTDNKQEAIALCNSWKRKAKETHKAFLDSLSN